MAADGWHWLGWMDNAILDDNGQVRSIIGVGRDITERRQMEQQLRESEERFSKAFYQLDIAMELVQIDQGTRVDFNDKYCELTGYSRDELLESNIYDKNLWINPEGQIKAADELKQKGTLSGYPMDIVTKSGTRKNLLLSAAKLYLSREEHIAIAALVDITHLKQAEAALRESEARFRAVFNQQYQFMAILDPDGKTIAINDLPLLTGGYERTQFVGKYFWDSPAWQGLPEWHEIWRQRLHQVAETQQAVHTEDVYETVDGTRRYADSSTSAILNADGQVQYYLIEATDTTERRQAEAQRDELLQQVQQLNRDLEKRVEQRTAELKAVNKELEAFSYSVSHDLRAPLRSIDGFSQALLEDYASQLDGDGQDYLNRVRNNAQRMGQLIDDMLQLSRVSRDDMRYEDVDMQEIALQVIESLRESDPDRQVNLTLGPQLSTHGDPRMIRIMLDNLLGNAWKFTAQQDQAEIVFERVESGADLFQIRDNGVGFDMQHAHKLFGAFQRLHGIKEFPGTGIGLATVQRIVDRHGGRVWAQAAPDQGATFYFTFSAGSSSETE